VDRYAVGRSREVPLAGDVSVFISHSSKDLDFVRVLATLLRAEGIASWLDDVELDLGDSLFGVIPDAIARSSHFIVVLSRNSIGSRWVRYELGQAMAAELAGTGPIVLPVVIDDCDIPPQLADRVFGDFSKPEKIGAALARLVRAIREKSIAEPLSPRERFEAELSRTTLRDADLRGAAHLCLAVLNAARNILFTTYRLGHGAYQQVPQIRVLLFFAHPALKCIRLQLYVTELTSVVHCRHRFTIDPTRQPHLTPAAIAWNSGGTYHMSYQTEYSSDPEAYVAEALRHGFTREKVANIIVHVASSLSVAIDRCVFYPSGIVSPVVFCIDSERKEVFPAPSHDIIAETIRDIVYANNTGRRSPLLYEDRDFVSDDRGIIDEVWDQTDQEPPSTPT
jgi:hypothetical protein